MIWFIMLWNICQLSLSSAHTAGKGRSLLWLWGYVRHLSDGGNEVLIYNYQSTVVTFIINNWTDHFMNLHINFTFTIRHVNEENWKVKTSKKL